jgi:gliding motility-associated-like protein
MKRLYIATLLMTLSIASLAQVVINEVMHKPGPNNNTNQGIRRKEYVEIYNKGCSPVDISCWVVGSAGVGIQTVTNPSYIGAFQFPTGTIINPGQHLVVGGTETQNNTAYNAADIDFQVSQFLNTNTCDPNTNWLLPNGDGWIALYDDTGTPVDAVYWSFSSTAPNLATDDDYASNPCVPSACSGITSLRSARQIIANFPTLIAFTGSATSNDLTFSRLPDGGTWTRNVPPSIAGSNQCNNGQCSSAPSFQLSSTSTAPSCGASNGSINLTASPTGGGITYTYTWTPNVSSSSSASNIASGTYQIKITSSTGCEKDTSITLTSGNAPTAIVVNPTNPSCGQSNGSINLGNVTGGVGPYNYSLNGGAYSTSLSYPNLASGTYTLSVRDANGCIYNAPDVTLSNGSGPSAIATTISNPSCGQANGAINLGTVTGGVAPYTYSINGGAYSTLLSYPNLASGTYTLSVRDANGCIFNAPDINLTSTAGPTAVNVTTVDPQCGQSNGSFTVNSVTGGSGPYQYSVNGAAYVSGVSTFNNLAAGSYSLDIKDNNGCIYNAPAVNINNSNAPTAVAVNLTQPTCGLSNGEVNLGNVTGGTAPYSYNFNGQGNSGNSQYSGLSGGNYSLSVTDAAGCIYNAPAIILNSSNAPSDILYTITNAKCGSNNGAINITSTTGGSAPFNYSLNGGPSTSTLSYSNLSAGNYTLQVTDNGGCTYIETNIVVTVTPAITNIISIVTNSTCSQPNGAIDISNVLGGTQPFTYNFNNGSQFTAQTSYAGLSAGSYTITAQDANLCLYTVSVSVQNDNSINGPQQLFTTLTQIECGASNGAIKIDSVKGGVSPYQYKFENSVYSSQLIYENLPSGIYNISIKDSNSCVLDTIVVIPESFDASGIFIPNAFTPNNDAFNASWGLEANCAKSVEGYIYNRWGEKIADITDKGFRWDGKYKNREAPMDVYAYTIEITYLSERKEKRSGVISLIR